MQLQPQAYLAKEGKWNFRVTRIKEDWWSVIRWPADGVPIPPRSEILTVDGWRPLLGPTEGTRYFSDVEVAQIDTGMLTLPA